MTIKNSFRKVFAKHHLELLFESLESEARVAVQLDAEEFIDEENWVGRSRLGGTPDLPDCVEWPWSSVGESSHPMAFVAQINLRDLAIFRKKSALDAADKSSLLSLLPSEGVLYFFFGPDSESTVSRGDSSTRFAHCEVAYFPGSSLDLREVQPPPELKKEEICTARFCEFRAVYSFPCDASSPWGTVLKEWPKLEDLKAYHELRPDFDGDAQILGHPAYVDGPVETAVVHCLSEKDPSVLDEKLAAKLAPLFGTTSKDWVLLFSIHSDEECSMNWGHGGALCFMMTEEDLRSLRFDRVVCCVHSK